MAAGANQLGDYSGIGHDPLAAGETAQETVRDALPSEDEVRSTSSDDSSESASSDAEPAAEVEDAMPSVSADIPGPCWMNKKSKTVHKVGMADDTTFCGRCTMCYRADLICSRDAMASHLKEMADRKKR
ncbi:unnamed protein product [Cladocopium goreaui]|uniref:Uncharacterized protein n=1 Tax=Cladocopium goreaui TaxID=2562237 RepID=A0A9P1FZ11_9DINO|nr:unnamed protein product [Cladocopium goreaui]